MFENYRRLVLAIVVQAIKDATSGDNEARDWFLSEGLHWMELCDINISLKKVNVFIDENNFWDDLKIMKIVKKEYI